MEKNSISHRDFLKIAGDALGATFLLERWVEDMLDLLKTRNWPRTFGCALFISMMASGYYYNLTFVIIGLEDFGTYQLGLGSKAFARDMALLAVFTCLTALVFGFWMQRQSWRRSFQTKLRLSFGVVLAQTLLTLLCPLVRNETVFIAWLVGVLRDAGLHHVTGIAHHHPQDWRADRYQSGWNWAGRGFPDTFWITALCTCGGSKPAHLTRP